MMWSEKNVEPIHCNLMPGIGVGPFRFGDAEAAVTARFRVKLVDPPFEEATWRTYEVLSQEIRLYFDDDEEEIEGLSRIGCFRSLVYDGCEIVGLSLEQVRWVLGVEEELEVEPDGRTTLEYWGELCLQVWLGQDGLCESVMCHSPRDDEE